MPTGRLQFPAFRLRSSREVNGLSQGDRLHDLTQLGLNFGSLVAAGYAVAWPPHAMTKEWVKI